jgi:1-aminocyclopropane-1-carboxylate deaminase
VVEKDTGTNLLQGNAPNLSAASIEKIDLAALHNGNIVLNVLRLDKIHPVISGNKWFKLKYYLQDAIANKHDHIITFGGAYSNHIVAAAYAANAAGLKSTGIIRGEKSITLSPALKDAMDFGMQLEFISRENYLKKNEPEWISALLKKNPGAYIIPAGGEGEAGVEGAAEILNLVDKTAYTHLICAVGTGTMLKGMAASSLPDQQVIGIPVLKGFDNWLEGQYGIDDSTKQRIQLLHNYHFGGYAKNNASLFAFMNEWYAATRIPLDFVYTGKLLFAVSDLIKNNYFAKDSRLLVVHSGGLQGNRSLPEQTLIF